MTRISRPRPEARNRRVIPTLQWREIRPYLLLALACLVTVIVLIGCGGGSSSNNNNGGNGGNNGANNGGNNGGATSSLVSGSVTNYNADPFVGATVQLGNLQTTTKPGGIYTIPNAPFGVQTITASATVNGVGYSGQNTMEAIQGEANTSNVHLLLSPTATQGAITGTVKDSVTALPISGAKVFAQIPEPTGKPFFTTLGSIYAVTDANGNYQIPKLPSNRQFTVTASLAGYQNQTFTPIIPLQAGSTNTNFILTKSTTPTNDTFAKVTNFSLLSITTPNDITRAAGTEASQSALNAIKYYLLKKRGLLNHRAADLNKITLKHQGITRAAGQYIIENDLFWDYTPLNFLFGYEVLRSTSANSGFVDIALLRDPLGDRFSDLDAALVAGTAYYYSVARLDTINFPNGNDNLVTPIDPLVTIPLPGMELTAPANGVTLNGLPTFQWTAVQGTNVQGATQYQVLIYDQFPTYSAANGVDANATPVFWPPNSDQPANAGLVTTTQLAITNGSGLNLTSGHTYYWIVIATDARGDAVTISPIRSFIAL